MGNGGNSTTTKGMFERKCVSRTAPHRTPPQPPPHLIIVAFVAVSVPDELRIPRAVRKGRRGPIIGRRRGRPAATVSVGVAVSSRGVYTIIPSIAAFEIIPVRTCALATVSAVILTFLRRLR